MAKKEQAIQQPVEIDASKGIASLKELQGLVNELNKSLRITANVMKDLGGSHSVALASALSPSRDMKGTNAAVKGFVSGTEALTDLQRAQNQGMNISAKAALAQTQSTAAARQALNEDTLARYGTLNQSAVAKAKAENISTVAKARADAIHKTGAAKLHEQGLRDTAKGLKDIEYTAELVDREEKRQAKQTEGFKIRVNFQTEAQRLRRKEKAEEKEEAERKKAAERAEKEAKARVDRGDRAAAALAQKAKFADIGVKAAADKEVAKQGTEAAKLANKLALQGGTTKELIELRARLRSSRAARSSSGGAVGESEGVSGRQLLGMLPGGSTVGRLAQMFPAVNRAVGEFSHWGTGSLRTGAPPVGGIGPIMQRSALGIAGAGVGVLAGGAALAGGAVVAGVHYSTGKMQDAYGGALGQMMGMEQSFRRTAQAGGGAGVMDSLRAAGGARLRSSFGMSNEAIAAASGSFLDARGMSTASSDQSQFLATGERFLGGDHGIGGSASALGYSGDAFDRMARSGRQSGLGGSALRAGVSAQLGAEARASMYGMHGSGIAESNMAYAQQLSMGGFGGGAYGGIAAVNKLQGAGSAMMDGIRGNLRQIADTMVVVEAFKKGGSFEGGIDAEAKMSAEDRMRAIQKAGPAAAFGLQGLGFSAAQARGMGDRFMPQLGDVQGYNVARSRAASVTDNTVLEAGVSGGMLESIQKLELATKELSVATTQSIAAIQGMTDVLVKAKNNVPGWASFSLAALP